jgi:NADH dehydrogenase
MAEVTVLGGTGFLGRRIVEMLAKRGHDVRSVARRPEIEAHASAAPTARRATGSVRPFRADIRDMAALCDSVGGADAVVNAVSLYVEQGTATFEALHVEAARRVAETVREAAVPRLVHFSGIGADPRSRSPYVRSRGRGDRAVHEAFPAATIMRPSAMFSEDDGLVATLNDLLRRSWVIPLFGHGHKRLQPVFVGDVAAAVARSLDAPWTAGKMLELGGPRVYSYRALLVQVMRITGRTRLLLPVPFAVWAALAGLGRHLPRTPITEGQVALMRRDNVVGERATGFDALGIRPTAIETVLRERLRMDGQ